MTSSALNPQQLSVHLQLICTTALQNIFYYSKSSCWCESQSALKSNHTADVLCCCNKLTWYARRASAQIPGGQTLAWQLRCRWIVMQVSFILLMQNHKWETQMNMLKKPERDMYAINHNIHHINRFELHLLPALRGLSSSFGCLTVCTARITWDPIFSNQIWAT